MIIFMIDKWRIRLIQDHQVEVSYGTGAPVPLTSYRDIPCDLRRGMEREAEGMASRVESHMSSPCGVS